MNKIIMLLGSPNDNMGKLSQIAIDRNDCAFNIYKINKDIKMLCTGGFGKHFNNTNLPHAQYSKDYLISKGADENDFLPFILSSNTYEDLEMAKPVVEKENPDLLIVITSDFHIERVKLLYDRIIGYSKIIFISAMSTLSEEELQPIILHEKNALRIQNTLNSNNMEERGVI